VFGREKLELVGVPVVVPAWCTQLNVVPRSLARERVGVGGNVRGAGAVPRRREYVDAEGISSETSDRSRSNSARTASGDL
jgi:hypothetical protein